MKYFIVLFLVLNIYSYPQQKITGTVYDSETNQFLANANIIILERSSGGTTDNLGVFNLTGDIQSGDVLSISYIGYETRNLQITQSDFNRSLSIYLVPKIIPSQTILIEASVGKEGITPLAFEKIKRKEIEESYTVQDIPQFLSHLPSTTFYSENGNGLGYNYLSIRGFDQRRISVSINGIPQNDPEDHNVYWLDFPDLLASTDFIQVQRGAGSGVFGYPAIGGSINLITSAFSNKPKYEISAHYGSYHTRKYSASFSSGLIDERYSIYAKLSQILSSGYRDLSWIKFYSYYLSAVRFDNKLTTQLNLYGGPIEDGLSYTGLPKFAVKDKSLRKANYSDWEADAAADTFTYFVPRRSSEIENFSQPHFELLNEYKFDNNLKFNSALFLVMGTGFFDYDGSWSIYYDDYFRLKENDYDPNMVPVNALIRAQVENKQWGWIPRLSYSFEKGELAAGGEFRIHRSDHWGSINYAENLPAGLPKDYRYYFYNGSKDIINGFVHSTFNVNKNLNLLAELQVAYHNYAIKNEKYLDNEFSIDGLFLNPRVGVNYKVNPYQNIYLSAARVTREPRLKNYYDAAESSGGLIPQFERKGDNGPYDFNNPLVEPETMNDIELGTSINSDNFNLSVNLFYMLFNNEIVKNGELDRFGQPITGNVKSTVHRGIELSGAFRFLKSFEFRATTTYSSNYIEEGNTFVEYNINDSTIGIGTINLSRHRISGFPDFLANAELSYRGYGFYFSIRGKYLGKFYSDNYDEKLSVLLEQFPGFSSYDDNVNDAYFIADFSASYELNLFSSLTPSKLIFQINNIFDIMYSAYAIGKEFFPAAERNFLAGIQIGL